LRFFQLALFALAVTAVTPARAGYGVISSDAPPPDMAPALTQGLKFEQKLDSQVPADAEFHDENGQTVKLGDYFGQRPTVLVLAYFKCPNLCTVVIREAFQALQAVHFDGRDDPYSLIVLSIDPQETPALADKKQREHLKSYPQLQGAGYTHFLTGNENQIRRVADSIGFQYRWDDNVKQYIHPSGLTVLTPQGKVSKYLYGVRYEPRDVRLALVEASEGKIGTLSDKMTLFCFQYDPASGKYGFMIMSVLRVFGGITATALGGMVFATIRRERRRKTNSKESDSVR